MKAIEVEGGDFEEKESIGTSKSIDLTLVSLMTKLIIRRQITKFEFRVEDQNKKLLRLSNKVASCANYIIYFYF